jgi:hypothetical protein
VQYRFNLSRVGLDALFVHHVTQKSYRLGGKATLVGIKFQIDFLESGENLVQMTKVFPPILAMYIKVINKHLQESATLSLKTSAIVRKNVFVAFLSPNGMTV